ncbi:winged helix-turn-helix domain-containing protein [Photobacterium minamisatsumaniensis]|uniref:winged helix-turn-helix domain-containing protein n=1 Tax=Photobacterium minamisatsumaniensis TaxID=2910233 RepID=UPI003D0C978B
MLYKISEIITFNDNEGKINSYKKEQCLNKSENAILSYLCTYSGEAIPKETLKKIGWPDQEASDQSLAQVIYSLRKKLYLCGEKDMISTISKQGYQINNIKGSNNKSRNSLQANRLEKIIQTSSLMCLFLVIFYYSFTVGDNKSTETMTLSMPITYNYGNHRMTVYFNDTVSEERLYDIESISSYLPEKSNVISFITKSKTFIVACPINMKTSNCDTIVSPVLEIVPREKLTPISPKAISLWLNREQEIKNKNITSYGIMMLATNYTVSDDKLLKTQNTSFILELDNKKHRFNHLTTNNQHKGKYKGSISYKNGSNKNIINSSHNGTFELKLEEKTNQNSLVLTNRKITSTQTIRNKTTKIRISANDNHVILKVANWGNQSLWLSESAEKIWLFEENPLY